MSTETARSPRHDLTTRSRAMVGMLTVEFLAGMALNLVGLPSKNHGAARATGIVASVVHITVALGLLVGAVRALRAAPPDGGDRPAVLVGGATIVVTVVAGILTAATDSAWLSYLMAVGFLASLLVYGRLLVRP
jgi:hypothetical protein